MAVLNTFSAKHLEEITPVSGFALAERRTIEDAYSGDVSGAPASLFECIEFPYNGLITVCEFSDVLNTLYVTGTITVNILWRTTTTSGGIVLRAEMKAFTAGTDNATRAWGTKVDSGSAQAAPGTVGIIKASTLALDTGAKRDNVAAGEEFRLRISRVSTSTIPADDMSASAFISKVFLTN